MKRIFMYKGLVLLILLAVITISASPDEIGAVTIMSYDIEGTPTSGFGNWHHTYDDLITGTSGDSDYSGGSGTLNDGIFGTNKDDTHLFFKSVFQSITLHLEETYLLTEMVLWSHPIVPNSITGTIESVEVNGTSYTASDGPSRSEMIDFGTGLTTNTLTLTGFTGTHPDHFAISEVTFEGSISSATVPEPTTFALLGIGLTGLVGGYLRRKVKKRSKQLAIGSRQSEGCLIKNP